jgi:hypothetical protein
LVVRSVVDGGREGEGEHEQRCSTDREQRPRRAPHLAVVLWIEAVLHTDDGVAEHRDDFDRACIIRFRVGHAEPTPGPHARFPDSTAGVGRLTFA